MELNIVFELQCKTELQEDKLKFLEDAAVEKLKKEIETRQQIIKDLQSKLSEKSQRATETQQFLEIVKTGPTKRMAIDQIRSAATTWGSSR